jgi:hypothetical protein
MGGWGKLFELFEQFKPFRQMEDGTIPLMAGQTQAPEK